MTLVSNPKMVKGIGYCNGDECECYEVDKTQLCGFIDGPIPDANENSICHYWADMTLVELNELRTLKTTDRFVERFAEVLLENRQIHARRNEGLRTIERMRDERKGLYTPEEFALGVRKLVETLEKFLKGELK